MNKYEKQVNYFKKGCESYKELLSVRAEYNDALTLQIASMKDSEFLKHELRIKAIENRAEIENLKSILDDYESKFKECLAEKERAEKIVDSGDFTMFIDTLKTLVSRARKSAKGIDIRPYTSILSSAIVLESDKKTDEMIDMAINLENTIKGLHNILH